MQNLYTDAQSKKMDQISQENFSIPDQVLMEDAAFSTYTLIKDRLKKSSCTLFIAGGGNNGGDALAIARLAYLDHCSGICILLADSGKETALRAKQRLICENIGIQFLTDWDSAFANAQIIIDGLFGVGLKGIPRSPFDSLIARINALKIEVISLDLPSGIGDNVPHGNGIRATTTICMGAQKTAIYLPQNRDFCGQILTTLPFFPDAATPQNPVTLLDHSDLQIPTIAPSSYKKTRGSIAIIGGSGHFTGAVILSAKAAFHAGAGLVTIFTAPNLVPLIAKAIPSAMVTTYTESFDLSQFDAVLCGPGLGSTHDQIVQNAITQSKRLVIDADGIRAFARLSLKLPTNIPCIMTPHLGEYTALLSAYCPNQDIKTPSGWISSLSAISATTGSYLIVKANTVWLKTDSISVIDGQNPSLGVAGSGDVLSGITVALLASTSNASLAAKNAAILHQKAGRLATAKLGFYTSDDLIPFIGQALKY